MQQFQKEWQVEVLGQVYEASFDELEQWIVEGSVLPEDRVKKRNLRWIKAEKVPELQYFFVSRESENQSPLDDAPAINSHNLNSPIDQFPAADETGGEPGDWQDKVEKVCHLHTDHEYAFACDVCEHYFCKTCPKSYGGSVRICPLCDSLCRSVSEPADIHKSVGAINKPYVRVDKNINAEDGGKQFSIPAFGKASAYLVNFSKSVIEEGKSLISSRINRS